MPAQRSAAVEISGGNGRSFDVRRIRPGGRHPL